jgi:rubredoxin
MGRALRCKKCNDVIRIDGGDDYCRIVGDGEWEFVDDEGAKCDASA